MIGRKQPFGEDRLLLSFRPSGDGFALILLDTSKYEENLETCKVFGVNTYFKNILSGLKPELFSNSIFFIAAPHHYDHYAE